MTKTSLLAIACLMGMAVAGSAVAAPTHPGRQSWSSRQHEKGALPDTWFIAGDNKQEYEGGTDSSVTYAGKPSGYLESIGFNLQGYGSLVNIQDATPYLGKRVRVSAMLKSYEVQRWAGLWVGLDSETQPFTPDGKESDRFRVLHDTPLLGTMDWRTVSIEIVVPPDTEKLLFGLAMAGRGKAYINRVSVDVVTPQLPTAPNLDF